ncbi:MAG: hypothetical protein PHQ58_04240 [Rhodoferax sp.]|uniref:hypothetical protein n=1 Tax=Rhodoferax sp. TaxID=50421 RepID=UPI002628FC3C|nr:hypothetical protein [Rhodoferax sp.]MDD2879624.1 hypothetical protein [Rhodoferax sp.]
MEAIIKASKLIGYFDAVQMVAQGTIQAYEGVVEINQLLWRQAPLRAQHAHDRVNRDQGIKPRVQQLIEHLSNTLHNVIFRQRHGLPEVRDYLSRV